MNQPSLHEYPIPEVAEWLVTAFQGHLPAEEIHSTLTSRFGLQEDEARIAARHAREGILRAISGTRKNSPDKLTDPLGYAVFELIWSSFNQNSFFDRRRSPSRQWLDWKAQQLPANGA